MRSSPTLRTASLGEEVHHGALPAFPRGFLAERFETTGGDIQAIALEAAFLAAAAGEPISMSHLMRAMTRRQTKNGIPGGWERYREHRDALALNQRED